MALKHKSLSSRDKARKMAQKAQRQHKKTIDLTDVEFISRSFADELVKQAKKRNLEIVGATGDVEKTLQIVG